MKSKIFLITGQSGTGKQKLGEMIKDKIVYNAVHIEGRELRDVTSLQSFSGMGRINNMKNAFLISSFLSSKDIPVIITMVAPYRSFREIFKQENQVVEIYLNDEDSKKDDKHYLKNYEKPCENFIEIKIRDKNEVLIFNEFERKYKKLKI